MYFTHILQILLKLFAKVDIKFAIAIRDKGINSEIEITENTYNFSDI